MLVVAFGHFNRIGISVAGSERIIPEYGIKPDRMGMIYSAFLLFYTLAMIPGGWLIDRFGARAALIALGLGSTLFVAGTGSVGYAASEANGVWLGLLVMRSLLGLFNAPLHPASARMVFERVPAPSRAFSNGLVTFAACVGMSAAFYVFGTMIDVFDWPTAFIIASGMTLAVTGVWTFASRPSREARIEASAKARPIHDPKALKRVLLSKSVVCITLSYAAYGYFQYLFFYWINYYFDEIQHEERGVARGYSTLITMAMGIGMASGGWVADRVPASYPPRLRRAIVPVVGMIGGGILFELGLLGPNANVTLVAFSLAAGFIGACEGTFWTSVVELGGRFGGTSAGLMNMGGNAGGTLSPTLTPLLAGIFAKQYGPDLGWRLSLAIAGGIVIAGAALWWGIDEKPDDGEKAEVLNFVGVGSPESIASEPSPSLL